MKEELNNFLLGVSLMIIALGCFLDGIKALPIYILCCVIASILFGEEEEMEKYK